MTDPIDLTPEVIGTRLGPVEFARVGAGQPVVVLHGSPGGIDAAELMARFLPRDTTSAILLSRPGYLGTELGERRSIDEQADLVIALLDALDIPSAGVLSWSGGGPCGYRLAVRHADRIDALVAFAALSKAYHAPKTSLTDRLMFGTSTGQWLLRVLAAHRPGDVVTGTLQSESSLTGDALKERVASILADPAKLDFVLALGPTASTTKERKAGFDNDLAQFAAIDSLELERITTPTLVVQGGADTDVTPDFSDFAVATIPGAQRLDLADGSHLALYTHPDAANAQRQVVDFFLAHRR